LSHGYAPDLIDPRRLTGARLQLHWAAQPAAAVGKRLLPHQPDYSEQSFEYWDGALVQGAVAADVPFRSALRLRDLTLLLLSSNSGDAGNARILDELPLPGRTLEEAFAWLEATAAGRLDWPLDSPFERPGEMPAHPAGEGQPFPAADPEALAEIDRGFSAAHRLLSALAERSPGTSPVRCWPHHFDLATLITVEAGATPEESRTIGAGFSPGDGGRPLPYFYVTPWPYPSQPALPELEGGGTWNTEGWLGAVLEDLRFPAGGSRERMERFLASAVAACRGLL
jgi:hypothetical protein